jgi:hypothetical protein
VITNGKSAGQKFLHIDLSDLKVKNLPYGTTTPTSSQAGDDFPISDVCAAIAHWRAVGTINGELLPYCQRSIRTSEAAKHGVAEAANAPARPSQSPTSPPNVADARRPRSRSLQASPGDRPRGTASALLAHLQGAASPPRKPDPITDLDDQPIIAASPPRKPDPIIRIDDVSRLSRRTFLTATGNLIDFSLARQAKAINAQVDFSTNADNEPIAEVSIADNGTGMHRDGLEKAIRQHTGAFAIAAASLCERTRLVSTPGNGKPLDQATGDWKQTFRRRPTFALGEATPEQSHEFWKACETLSDLSGQATDHGTLVICEKGLPLSTISGGRSFKSESRQRGLVEDLRAFLSLLFSEYAGDVVIAVNGDPLSSGQTTRVEPHPLA